MLTGSSPNIRKPFISLTISPVKNGIISAEAKLMEIRFVPAGPIYLRVFIHNCDAFSGSFLIIVKCYPIHRLQFGFINVFV